MANATHRQLPFGALLREFRLAAGLSQEALAERATMSADGIGALERGVNKAPQRETLALLLEALQLKAEQRDAIEAAARRPSRPRASERRAKKHNLPPLLAPLFGRENDLAEIEGLLPRSQVLTLTGAGGVGKTRLAIEVGRAARDCVDGVWFADLAPLRDPNGVPAAIGRLFGVNEHPDRPPLRDVVDTLCRKNALLIFDNCEHVVEGAASAIEAISAGCSEVRILATSRQPLHVAGEQTYRVASLNPRASAELFADAARRADASFVLDDEDAPIVERICARLDGIALAIELAAARVKLLSITQIEELLSKRFSILTGGGRLARHQTMRALVDWSYELLSKEEQTLFDRLAVFPSGFAVEAAIAICSGKEMAESRVLDTLGSLVDKSLVTSERWGKVRRFRLLETMHAYALEKLGPEVERLNRKHAEHYVAIVEAMDTSVPKWSEVLEREYDNVHRALEWSIDDGSDVALGVRLLAGAREVLLLRGLGADAARRAERALRHESELEPRLQAMAWETLAAMRGSLLLPADAFEAAGRALELYKSLDDSAGIALALRTRGVANLRLGRFAEGEADLQRALELSKRYGARRDLLRALGSLGVSFEMTGRLEEGRKTTLEVLEMARNDGDDRLVWVSSMNLGEMEFALGEIESAVSRMEGLLASKMAHQNVRMRANTESNLSAYLIALRREPQAREMARSAVNDAREAGDRGVMACALGHLAALLSRRDPKNAARLLGYVESVFAGGYSREHTERYTHELLMSSLHEALAADEITALGREGAAMSEAQAVRIATRLPKLMRVAASS
jgi:predicted ATPase/DNA-binding XRE family transcriptional regulator